MTILYDVLFFFISLCYLPAYLFKKKFHSGFWARLGFLPRGLQVDSPVWIHAVSVGEAVMMKPLIESLRKSFPQEKFVISTVTATGNKIARALAQPGDFVTYMPLDFSFIVTAVIKKINPRLFIIAETELWPNLITCLYKNKIPCVVVNARISDKSFGGYQAIRFFLKPVLKKVSLFSAQSLRDQERLFRLGVPKEKVVPAGNMKFDLRITGEGVGDYTEHRKRLGLGTQEKLFVAASTHAQEEEIIIATFKKLLNTYPSLRLLLAPRHPERAPEIERLIERLGFTPLRISQLGRQPITDNRQPIAILDSVGELMDYYAIADIVFVGGSLVAHGGHNILEPALLGKPIVFGPHMFNFRDIADLFLQHDAALLVKDEAEAFVRIKELLDNSVRAKELGARARSLIKENQGATLRNLKLIESLLTSLNDKK